MCWLFVQAFRGARHSSALWPLCNHPVEVLCTAPHTGAIASQSHDSIVATRACSLPATASHACTPAPAGSARGGTDLRRGVCAHTLTQAAGDVRVVCEWACAQPTQAEAASSSSGLGMAEAWQRHGRGWHSPQVGRSTADERPSQWTGRRGAYMACGALCCSYPSRGGGKNAFSQPNCVGAKHRAELMPA